MVNQKNLAIARIMLVSFCACSCGFCMRPAILAAVCAQLPKRTIFEYVLQLRLSHKHNL